MARTAPPFQGGKPGSGKVPPLRNGDRLTREEFERRWDAMPELKRAELLEGIVYVPPPTSLEDHSIPDSHLSGWLCHYVAGTPGIQCAAAGSIRMDPPNMPQPDGFLFILPERGGCSRKSADDYLEGAPELAAEVSATSASYDLHVKKEVYRRNGVLEYVVVRTFGREVDWFVLKDGRYEALAPGRDGIYRSATFPGLWLDPQAILGGDLKRLFRVLDLGLSTREHAAFVERLSAGRGSRPGRRGG